MTLIPPPSNDRNEVLVFTGERKRRRTQETSFPIKIGPPARSKRLPDKPISLTKDDAELVSHISTASGGSEDTLEESITRLIEREGGTASKDPLNLLPSNHNHKSKVRLLLRGKVAT